MEDVEAHEYPLGSTPASIIGLANRLLERTDLDAELMMHLRAIRDLAFVMVREAERSEPRPRKL